MPLKQYGLIVCVGVPCAVLCVLTLLYGAAGYHFEDAKFKHLILTISLVFSAQFIILDPIKFVIQAALQTFFQGADNRWWYTYRAGISNIKNDKNEVKFLKLRIDWLKSHLSYNWKHKDEEWNVFYRNNAEDIFLYGKYYICLALLASSVINPLQFYYSNGLLKNIGYDQALDRVTQTFGNSPDNEWRIFMQTIENGYILLQGNDSSTTENWMPGNVSKFLGVARVRQIRLKKRLLGDVAYTFEDRNFDAGWKPFHFNRYYVNKYWRLYEPWLPASNGYDGLISKSKGYLSKYPNTNNYIVYLECRVNKSLDYLKYLETSNWIDRHTAALFLDFTTYSSDSNLFGFCRIKMEFTPFGNVILEQKFESESLMIDWRNLSAWYWITIAIYAVQLLKLIQTLALKIWFGNIYTLLSFWNFIDLLIIIGNVLIFIFLYLRETAVLKLLENYEFVPKEQYQNFNVPKDYSRITNICLGFTLFISTIRIWKVLVFLRVVRLFLRTLQLGFADIFWATASIMIVLIGLMVSSSVMNSTKRTKNHAPMNLIHILSFSLGCNERVNPLADMSLKSRKWSIIVYGIAVFFITLILFNILITLIWYHYVQAKEKERSNPPGITFLEFLKAEYEQHFIYLRKICKKIEHILRLKFLEKLQFRLWWDDKESVDARHKNHLRLLRIKRDLLSTQAQLIEHRMKELNIYVQK